MRLNCVQGVSIPRSGHHLLARLLSAYLGPELYCDYYDCCQKTPCAKGKYFQKHHDLLLLLRDNTAKYHLIQFRKNPQAQFEAYFRFFKNLYAQGDRTFDVQNTFPYFINYYNKYFTVSNDPERLKIAYDQFVKDHLYYYRRFVQKWIYNLKSEGVLLLAYEDLVAKPEDALIQSIRLFGINQIDEQKLSDALSQELIGMKTVLEDSPLYDSNFDIKYNLESIRETLNNL